MKKIILSLMSFLILASAQAFCGFGTPSVPTAPLTSPPCSCPSNRVAIYKVEGTCHSLCVLRNKLQSYQTQGWLTGCCPALRLSSHEVTSPKIYPNPVSGTAIMQFNTHEERLEHFRIVDATGRTVIQTSFHALPGENSIALPTESLPPGMYYLWFESNNEVLKIIVQ